MRLRVPRHVVGAFLAGALLAVGVAPGAATEPPPALQGVRRIVALGDSITEAASERGGYVWLIERSLRTLYPLQRIKITNAGVGGHRATDLEARFQKDVLDRRPDLVMINVGVNDVWHAFRDFQARRDHPAGDLPGGVPLPLYREKLKAMIDAARTASVRVVLVSPTVIYEDLARPENGRLVEYVSAMRALGRQHGLVFVDVNAVFREVIAAYQRRAGTGLDLLTTDGVHLNAAGNRLMAHTILLGLGVPERELATARLAD